MYATAQREREKDIKRERKRKASRNKDRLHKETTKNRMIKKEKKIDQGKIKVSRIRLKLNHTLGRTLSRYTTINVDVYCSGFCAKSRQHYYI